MDSNDRTDEGTMKIQFKQTALRIHTSLIAIGIWYVLQGNLMSLLVAVLTLFLHEAGHFIEIGRAHV